MRCADEIATQHLLPRRQRKAKQRLGGVAMAVMELLPPLSSCLAHFISIVIVPCPLESGHTAFDQEDVFDRALLFVISHYVLWHWKHNADSFAILAERVQHGRPPQPPQGRGISTMDSGSFPP